MPAQSNHDQEQRVPTEPGAGRRNRNRRRNRRRTYGNPGAQANQATVVQEKQEEIAALVPQAAGVVRASYARPRPGSSTTLVYGPDERAKASKATPKKGGKGGSGKGGKGSGSGKGPSTSQDDPEGVFAVEDSIHTFENLKKGGVARQTLPTNANVLGMLPWAFLPRRQYQSIDLTTLDDGLYNAQQLIDLLVDAYPEMGQAMWNFVRLADTQWNFEVRSPDNTNDDPEGKAILDQVISNINKEWGGFNLLVTQAIMSVVAQGACSGETVPNDDFDGVADLAMVQPWTIYFQRDMRQNYIAYQWQPMMAAAGSAALASAGTMQYEPQPGDVDFYRPNHQAVAPSPMAMMALHNHGGFRLLNDVTFAYVPLDAEVDDPYGRLPLAPILQVVAFDAQLLKDLRQWAHVNAFGRMDVTVLADKVKDLMPTAVKNDAKKAADWLNQYIQDVIKNYNDVNPDDTFVHWDNISVAGIDSAGQTLNIDNLARYVERKIFRSLKQLPILMGSNEGTTETWGSIQMEVYARGVTAIQRVVAALFERLLRVVLRLYGHSGVVHFTFEPLRNSDRIKDATAESMEIRNAAAKRDEGWITQDEASIAVTGSEAVADAPDPDPEVAPAQPDAAMTAILDMLSKQGGASDQQTGDAAEAAATDQAQEKGKGSSATDSSTGDAADEAEQPPAKKPAKAKKGGKGGDAPQDAAKQAKNPKGGSRLAAHPVTRATTAATHTVVAQDRAEGGEAHTWTGAMVGHFLADSVAEALAIPDGEAPGDLHVTLAFLGDTQQLTEAGADWDRVRSALQQVAAATNPFPATVSGVGRFTAVPEGAPTPVYASVDAPALPAFREALCQALDANGVPADATHGFTPHITLAYIRADAPMPVDRVPALPFTVDAIHLALGGERVTIPLGGGDPLTPTPPGPPERAVGVVADRQVPFVFLADGNLATPGAGHGPTNPDADKPASGQDYGEAKNASIRDPHAGWQPKSATRTALAEHLAQTLRDQVFSQQRVPQRLLHHIVDLHSDRAVAENTATWEPLAQAVALISYRRAAMARGDTLPVARISNTQRDALIWSITRMLEPVFPDIAPELAAVLVDARLHTWDASGQEALARIGLEGEFKLTDSALIARIRRLAEDRVRGIQQFTRELVANAIAGALLAGASFTDIETDVRSTLDDMASGNDGAAEGEAGAEGGAEGEARVEIADRADLIAVTETDSAWYDAALAVWGRNGVPFKAWATGDNPDPHAGKSGRMPCLENAYASPIPIMSTFPSGDNAPPAHPYCACDVLPSGDPSDAALVEPWIGG